jgi:hypothetical protein
MSSDLQPWTVAQDQNVEAPSPPEIVFYAPFSVTGLNQLGLNFVSCRNCKVYLQVSNDDKDVDSWLPMWGTDGVTGNPADSVTFAGTAASYILHYVFRYAYGRIVAEYSTSLNDLKVIARRA